MEHRLKNTIDLKRNLTKDNTYGSCVAPSINNLISIIALSKTYKYCLFLFLIFVCVSFGQDSTYQNHDIEFKSLNKVIQITADSSTYDKKFGNSYRVLLVYHVGHDRVYLTRRIVLPINMSPDYPYRLLDKFEGDKNFVVIAGSRMFFIYDVVADSLTNPVFTKFPYKDGVDAQTGHIINLQLSKDGRILIGEARDFGRFSFDLTDPLSPKQNRIESK